MVLDLTQMMIKFHRDTHAHTRTQSLTNSGCSSYTTYRQTAREKEVYIVMQQLV